jgi:hypothetical protein
MEEVPRSIPNNNMANKILSLPKLSSQPDRRKSSRPLHQDAAAFHPLNQPVHPPNLPGNGNKYRTFFEIVTDCIIFFKILIFTN